MLALWGDCWRVFAANPLPRLAILNAHGQKTWAEGLMWPQCRETIRACGEPAVQNTQLRSLQSLIIYMPAMAKARMSGVTCKLSPKDCV
jgi:hypothetical protein